MGRAYAILTSLCYSGDDYEENGRRLFVEVRDHFLPSLFLHTYASILVALGFVKFSPSLIIVLRSRHAFFKLCPSLTLNQSTRCSSASTSSILRALASTLLAASYGTKKHLGRYAELLKPHLVLFLRLPVAVFHFIWTLRVSYLAVDTCCRFHARCARKPSAPSRPLP